MILIMNNEEEDFLLESRLNTEVNQNELNEKLKELNSRTDFFIFDNKSSTPYIDQIYTYVGYGSFQILQFLCSGFIFFVEGFYLSLIPSTIIPMKEYFAITDYIICVINVLLFLTIALGNIMLSQLTNLKISRKTIIAISFLINIPSTLAFATTSNIEIFTASYIMIGFSLGIIVPLMMNSMTEVMPIKYRAFTITFVWLFFALAEFVIPMLMNFVMPNLESSNLKYLYLYGSFICSIFFLSSFLLYVETPRNLLFNRKFKEAIKLLEKMCGKKISYSDRQIILQQSGFFNINASNKELFTVESKMLTQSTISENNITNNKERINTRISIDSDKSYSLSTLRKIFDGPYLKITIVSSVLWIINAIIFVGPSLIITMTVEELDKKYPSKVINITNSSDTNSRIISSLYFYSGVSAASIVVSSILIEIRMFGRRGSMVVTYFFGFVAALFMLIHPERLMDYFFIMTLFDTIGFNIMTSYTSELYSSDVRDSAMGYFFFVNRLGSIGSQFLFLKLFTVDLIIPYIVLCVMSLTASICSMMFPFETYGKSLDLIR